MVPMVTIMDGSSSLVTSRPLTAPARVPVARPIMTIAQVSRPWLAESPMTTPDRASMEATEMSISLPMMTRVMDRTIMAFSEKFWVLSARL